MEVREIGKRCGSAVTVGVTWLSFHTIRSEVQRSPACTHQPLSASRRAVGNFLQLSTAVGADHDRSSSTCSTAVPLLWLTPAPRTGPRFDTLCMLVRRRIRLVGRGELRWRFTVAVYRSPSSVHRRRQKGGSTMATSSSAPPAESQER